MNKTINYQLTIVVPVYNEEDNIYSLEQKLGEFLPKSICTACVLFVNDGSRDNSKQRIMEVCDLPPSESSRRTAVGLRQIRKSQEKRE